MELLMIEADGQAAGHVQVADRLFAQPYNEALIHQLMVAYRANARGGNRAQKGRSEIAKSTRKPWRQKGTGRARAGMASSPLWRGGGRIFPNSPEENFTQKVNRKMYRAGMASILSRILSEDRIRVVAQWDVAVPKTKQFVQQRQAMGLAEGRLLVVTGRYDEKLFLAARNLPDVQIIDPAQLNPIDLIHADRVVITQEALKEIEGMWV